MDHGLLWTACARSVGMDLLAGCVWLCGGVADFYVDPSPGGDTQRAAGALFLNIFFIAEGETFLVHFP